MSLWAELSSASYRDFSLRCGGIVLRGGNSNVRMVEKSRRVLLQPLRSYLKGSGALCRSQNIARERTIRNSQDRRGIYPRRSAADPAARRGSVGVDRFVCDWRTRPRARDERLRQPDHRLPVRDKIGGRLHDLRPRTGRDAARRLHPHQRARRHAGSGKHDYFFVPIECSERRRAGYGRARRVRS